MTVALGLWSAFLLSATLQPVAGPFDPQLEAFWCIPCGSRGTADAILNFAFFVPGGVLASRLFGIRRAVVGLALGVLAIEGLQYLIEGRHPSFSDIVFDTAGAWVGASLLSPRGFRLAARVAGVAAAAAWLAPPLLLVPVAPPDTLWGQWTAKFEGMAQYEGRVVRARVGPHEITSRRFPDDGLSRALADREEIRVSFVAGPPPRGLAPIFSVADRHGTHFLFVGADEDDVFVRVRALASQLRLEQPGWWVSDGLAAAPAGETVELEVEWQGNEPCIAVHRVEACDVTPGSEDGWRFLIASARPPGPPTRLASLLWCLLVGVLLGMSSRGPIRVWWFSIPIVTIAGVLALASPNAQLSVGGSIVVLLGSSLGVVLSRHVGKPAPGENLH